MTATSILNPYEHEREAERGRWLRRRFLWYTAVLAVFGALSIPLVLFTWYLNRSRFSPGILDFVSIALNVLSTGLCVAVFIYAWRSPPRRAVILMLAFWLYVVSGFGYLVGQRVAFQLDTRVVQGFERGVAAGAGATRPATRPDDAGRQYFRQQLLAMFAQPSAIFAIQQPFVMLFSHLIACLFIPWTARESLRPAAVVMAIIAVILFVDTVFGSLGVLGPLVFVGCLLAFVPGTLVCWWRYSRFNKSFRLRYESSGFRQLQNELGNARRLHEALFPAAITDGALRMHFVYEPMREIGGDLLFVHRPDPQSHRVSAVVLDVTGHGIAAAMTVNRIVGELQRLYGQSPDASPAQVVGVLNQYVRTTLAPLHLYVTAIVLRCDVDAGTLEHASAGHPTAFVLRSTGEIMPLESTHLLLGAVDQADFIGDQHETLFNVGDAVIAYTDGAMEARNEANQLLGTRGFQSILERVAGDGHAPADWPGAVLKRVLDYRGAPPDDDTLIVTLFRPKSITGA